ncbi:uncharacterized protein LOC130778119 [Actinidia eriantha]|uniref:uncharacterized protein LOC130778119 n=1 Tax=Actinidia eriantha TaxID=165200 RepID=UPI00258438A8|nr:uncharacterized protein LOC130778119 [Actinidia eriantha]
MFVKKLVEKASKKPGGIADGIKPEDIDPRLVFHYGIPSGSILLAYNSIQQILAIATNDGRIKLYGKDHTQAILESAKTVPSKFLKVWVSLFLFLLWCVVRFFVILCNDYFVGVASFHYISSLELIDKLMQNS